MNIYRKGTAYCAHVLDNESPALEDERLNLAGGVQGRPSSHRLSVVRSFLDRREHRRSYDYETLLAETKRQSTECEAEDALLTQPY